MANYTEVTPDVIGIASEIISHFHPDLIDAKIGFIFQEEAGKKLGKIILGNASKVTDKQRVVGLDLDFIIVIARDMWQELESRQKKALIDHELCHCDFSLGYAKMRGHDIEEFTCIVERYGLWKPDLTRFGEVVNQQILPGMEILKRKGAILSVKPEMAEMAEAA